MTGSSPFEVNSHIVVADEIVMARLESVAISAKKGQGDKTLHFGLFDAVTAIKIDAEIAALPIDPGRYQLADVHAQPPIRIFHETV
jgi:hypothetical protein